MALLKSRSPTKKDIPLVGVRTDNIKFGYTSVYSSKQLENNVIVSTDVDTFGHIAFPGDSVKQDLLSGTRDETNAWSWIFYNTESECIEVVEKKGTRDRDYHVVLCEATEESLDSLIFLLTKYKQHIKEI